MPELHQVLLVCMESEKNNNLGGAKIITFSGTLPSAINTETRYTVSNLTAGGICLGVSATNVSNSQMYDIIGASACSAYINGNVLRITLTNSNYIGANFVAYIMVM
jgi:hypothetical protein